MWLGLAKIGVTVALINYNLRSKSLVHTLTIGECRAVIYGLELESGKEIQGGPTEYYTGNRFNVSRIVE